MGTRGKGWKGGRVGGMGTGGKGWKGKRGRRRGPCNPCTLPPFPPSLPPFHPFYPSLPPFHPQSRFTNCTGFRMNERFFVLTGMPAHSWQRLRPPWKCSSHTAAPHLSQRRARTPVFERSMRSLQSLQTGIQAPPGVPLPVERSPRFPRQSATSAMSSFLKCSSSGWPLSRSQPLSL